MSATEATETKGAAIPPCHRCGTKNQPHGWHGITCQRNVTKDGRTWTCGCPGSFEETA